MVNDTEVELNLEEVIATWNTQLKFEKRFDEVMAKSREDSKTYGVSIDDRLVQIVKRKLQEKGHPKVNDSDYVRGAASFMIDALMATAGEEYVLMVHGEQKVNEDTAFRKATFAITALMDTARKALRVDTYPLQVPFPVGKPFTDKLAEYVQLTGSNGTGA